MCTLWTARAGATTMRIAREPVPPDRVNRNGNARADSGIARAGRDGFAFTRSGCGSGWVDYQALRNTMNTFWKSCLVSAGVALLASLSGCVAVVAGAAGAGTVAWVQGRLDAALDANFDKAEKAANQAIEQLQFIKIGEKKDALAAVFTVRTALDKKVDIKILRVGDASSQAQIRVGLFGDEALSLTILEKIKSDL